MKVREKLEKLAAILEQPPEGLDLPWDHYDYEPFAVRLGQNLAVDLFCENHPDLAISIGVQPPVDTWRGLPVICEWGENSTNHVVCIEYRHRDTGRSRYYDLDGSTSQYAANFMGDWSDWLRKNADQFT